MYTKQQMNVNTLLEIQYEKEKRYFYFSNIGLCEVAFSISA